MRICVVVLGDIGRSPRMQYQSLSLAEQGHVVDILGYGGSQVLADVKTNDDIRVHHLPQVPAIPVIRMRFLTYLWKTIWQFFTLWFAMVKLGDCFDTVLVQNPPAIPTLVVCWLYCFTYCKKFIIDWHNYAYTLMGEKCNMNSNPKRIIVRIAKFIEFYFGRKAQLNFCVSKAMQRHLKSVHDIESIVLYDQPNEIFRPITPKKQIDFLTTLSENRPDFRHMHKYLLPQEDSPRKWGLIISSTSWTEDEDFNILLSALKVYEKRAVSESRLPNLLCIITGKGPLKSYFQSLIRKQSYWDKVKFMLPWLDNAEYPLLLACADLGICLHTSSSGLDLPMKVLDMFGCTLPVLAYDYKCLSEELVQVGLCGYTFADDKQLADRLITWFTDYPKNSSTNETHQSFKDYLSRKYEIRWKQYWIKTVGKYFPAQIPISSSVNEN